MLFSLRGELLVRQYWADLLRFSPGLGALQNRRINWFQVNFLLALLSIMLLRKIMLKMKVIKFLSQVIMADWSLALRLVEFLLPPVCSDFKWHKW